jgi:hypothetical protein
MSTLAQQQQALLAMLFDWPNDDAAKNIASHVDSAWTRGQKVYQSNGHALACNALRAAYPVVAQLLGDESFDALARALWHASPPRQGDVTQWGDALPAFVAASAQLADEPYLPDVAVLEWALHTSASAADGAVDPASFALLTEHDPAQLHLCLSPGGVALTSAWPVVSILTAHLHQTPRLDQLVPLMQAGVGEDAVVWRHGLRAQVRVAQAGEAEFVAALLNGKTLGHALDLAPTLDVSAWLPMAVQTGLLLAVRLTPSQ